MERQNAKGIAAGLILAVLGGVTALILSAGPSIASALEGDNTPAQVEVDQQPEVEPSVYVIDENGNLITANEQMPADSDSAGQTSDAEEVYTDDDHYEHEEEDDDHYQDDDDREDDDHYENDDHKAYGDPANG